MVSRSSSASDLMDGEVVGFDLPLAAVAFSERGSVLGRLVLDSPEHEAKWYDNLRIKIGYEIFKMVCLHLSGS